MPKKTEVLASLPVVYRKAFDACVALWPIFFLRVGFLFLNLVFIVLVLAVCCWPFLQLILGHWSDFSTGNVKNLMDEVNWMSYFSDFKVLIPAALTAAFYLAFVSFFLAFFAAAVYSQMNRHQKDGSPFSWKSFFDGGIQKMIPMVGLQCAWLLVVLGGFVILCFLGVLGVFIAKLMSWWIIVLLALPAGLAGVFILMVFVTAAMLSGAYLVDGHGIWDSVKESVSKALQHKGRAMGAMLLLSLIYMIFLIAFTVVFSVLAMIPVIGILFGIFKFLVTSVMAIGFNIYMTSLGVAFQLEPKEPR
jgi:hypothetical protein